MGLADKAVSLLYERVLRQDQSKLWVERCQAQIGAVLEVLEQQRAALATPYMPRPLRCATSFRP
jgi:hypothetical protein